MEETKSETEQKKFHGLAVRQLILINIAIPILIFTFYLIKTLIMPAFFSAVKLLILFGCYLLYRKTAKSVENDVGKILKVLIPLVISFIAWMAVYYIFKQDITAFINSLTS